MNNTPRNDTDIVAILSKYLSNTMAKHDPLLMENAHNQITR